MNLLEKKKNSKFFDPSLHCVWDVYTIIKWKTLNSSAQYDERKNPIDMHDMHFYKWETCDRTTNRDEREREEKKTNTASDQIKQQPQ